MNQPAAKIFLVRGNSVISWFIKKATGSPYSHIGFIIDGRTYEMDFGGFISRELDTYAWPIDIYDINGVTEEETSLLKSWCLMHKYTPYDYGKVIGQGIDILLHVSGFRSILDSKKAMSCAEFVDRGLFFIEKKLEADCDKATPASIYSDKLIIKV